MAYPGDGEVLRYAGGNGEFPGIPVGPSRLAILTPVTVLREDGTVLVDATTGAFTVNLPSAVGIRGRRFTVVKVDASANAVTVDALGAQTINGALTLALSTQWSGVTLESDGANWVAATSGSSGGAVTQGIKTITVADTPYAVGATDAVILVDTTGGAVTVNLPAAAVAGRTLTIKKVSSDVNAVTLDGNGAETIDGQTTQLLTAQYMSLTIISDGVGWDIL